MESPSAPTCRGRVSWQGLLLAGERGQLPGGGQEDGKQRLAGDSLGAQSSQREQGVRVGFCVDLRGEDTEVQ